MLALPVALQMLLQSLLGMADVAMVSDFGANAVAAVGLSAKLHFLIMVLMVGVGTACSILVAQYMGAKNQAGCWQALALALLMGVLLAIPLVTLFVVSEWWLGLINPDEDVIRIAANYLLITAPAVALLQFITVYEAALRAVGDTLMPLATGAVAVFLNVFLNYVLIFGHFGFEALGVEGAAWATLIARATQLALILVWLRMRQHIFAFSFKAFWQSISLAAFKKFAGFSSSLVANHTLWGVGNTTYHIATGFAGTEALAVMGLMVPIESAFFSLFIGIASACAVMVGHALGADDETEAWRLHKFFDRVTLALVLVFCLALFLSRAAIIELFDSLDEKTAELMRQTIAVFCAMVWIKILNMLRILGVLRAGGDNRFCLITDSIVMWVFGIPIFLLGIAMDMPFIILFALMFLEDILKFVPVFLRVNKRFWIKNLTGALAN